MVDAVGHVGEQRVHLRLALKVELVVGEAEAGVRARLLQLLVDAAELAQGVFVVAVVAAQVVEQVVLHLALLREQRVVVGAHVADGHAVLLAGIHAQQQVVGRVVGLVHVVRVIGAYHLHVVLLGQAQQHLVHVLLAFAGAVEVHEPVPLNLHVEIVAKQIQPPLQLFLGRRLALEQDGLRNLGPDAATGGNQALMIPLNQLLVHARKLGVHALDETQRAQLGQVLVAGLVLGQQQLVVAVVLLAALAAEGFLVPVLHQVELAAHYRLDVVLISLSHKVERPEHVAVVGEGHGGHTVGLGLFHQRRNAGLAVEQRILGVGVQVGEDGHLVNN